MASRFLDFSPPVATALKLGTPIVAIETGFFMRLPYPKNKEALSECEQAFWRRDCVPCCIGADPILQDLVVIGYKVGNDPGEHVGVIIHPNEDLIKERTGKAMSWEDMERMVNLGVRQRCAKLADYKRPRKIVVWREPLERTSIQKVRRVAYQGKLDEK